MDQIQTQVDTLMEQIIVPMLLQFPSITVEEWLNNIVSGVEKSQLIMALDKEVYFTIVNQIAKTIVWGKLGTWDSTELTEGMLGFFNNKHFHKDNVFMIFLNYETPKYTFTINVSYRWPKIKTRYDIEYQIHAINIKPIVQCTGVQ